VPGRRTSAPATATATATAGGHHCAARRDIDRSFTNMFVTNLFVTNMFVTVSA
jgi:hypothetical protein